MQVVPSPLLAVDSFLDWSWAIPMISAETRNEAAGHSAETSHKLIANRNWK